MTPAARLQAAIEILDAVIAAAREEGAAADTLIARYFKDRRYAGSKDRRAIRDLVYDAIRSNGERPPSGRAAMLAHAHHGAPELLELFVGGERAPAPVTPDEPILEPSLAPAWLADRLRARFGDATEAELRALLDRAPLDLRVNTLKCPQSRHPGEGRDPVTTDLLGPGLRRDGGGEGGFAFNFPVSVVPTPYAPAGLRATEPFNVEQHPAYLSGAVEIQDEGSQLACLACDARPGQMVIDLCAGAGGKTLALAVAMANQGRLIAADANRDRLSRLRPRAERAGASIIETVLLNPGHELEALADLRGQADLVLVDAPCSGTGTWRRNPEARWRLTPERLERLTALQSRLLDIAAALVRPGGRIVYVVCSLLPEEGDAQIDAFLARQPGWQPAPFALPTGPEPTARAILSPARHGTDGFFIAGLSPI